MEALCGYINIDHEETLLACTFFPDLMLYSITRLYFSYTFYIHIGLSYVLQSVGGISLLVLVTSYLPTFK